MFNWYKKAIDMNTQSVGDEQDFEGGHNTGELFEIDATGGETKADIGQPFVFHGYHGTVAQELTDAESRSFGGFHAGTKAAAIDRIKTMGFPTKHRKIYEVTISLEKPLGSVRNPLTENQVFAILNFTGELEKVKENGFDGMIYTNSVEDPGSMSVVAFYMKDVVIGEMIRWNDL